MNVETNKNQVQNVIIKSIKRYIKEKGHASGTKHYESIVQIHTLDFHKRLKFRAVFNSQNLYNFLDFLSS